MRSKHRIVEYVDHFEVEKEVLFYNGWEFDIQYKKVGSYSTEEFARAAKDNFELQQGRVIK